MCNRRDEERAFGDAVYETWRRGGNPDEVTRDEVADAMENNYCDPYYAAQEVARDHRPRVATPEPEYEPDPPRAAGAGEAP